MNEHTVAIGLYEVSKHYVLYDRPSDRLRALMPWNRHVPMGREFHALSGINLEIAHGEVVGIVGRNGAGKSTLLQIVAQTLNPTSGTVKVEGTVAALLELGSGFNPDFSGRENVYLSAAIAGMSRDEIEKRFDAIVAFSGLEAFIDQPLKSYSSGMAVRLAFSVATSVEPDILIIDEALSVGDGAFARKSFERIMELRDRGCTILFCSHSLYQVEALCSRVAWIHQGEVVAYGEPHGVCHKYKQFLDSVDGDEEVMPMLSSPRGVARLSHALVYADEACGRELVLMSEVTTLKVDIAFDSDPALPEPTVAVVITDNHHKNVTSCSSYYDKIPLKRDAYGKGGVVVSFPRIGLLRGEYKVHVLLMCEQAIYTYDTAIAADLVVEREGLEVGVVVLPRSWNEA